MVWFLSGSWGSLSIRWDDWVSAWLAVMTVFLSTHLLRNYNMPNVVTWRVKCSLVRGWWSHIQGESKNNPCNFWWYFSTACNFWRKFFHDLHTWPPSFDEIYLKLTSLCITTSPTFQHKWHASRTTGFHREELVAPKLLKFQSNVAKAYAEDPNDPVTSFVCNAYHVEPVVVWPTQPNLWSTMVICQTIRIQPVKSLLAADTRYR